MEHYRKFRTEMLPVWEFGTLLIFYFQKIVCFNSILKLIGRQFFIVSTYNVQTPIYLFVNFWFLMLFVPYSSWVYWPMIDLFY